MKKITALLLALMMLAGVLAKAVKDLEERGTRE